MTKKELLERIEKIEEVVGSEDGFVNDLLSSWGQLTKKFGWRIELLYKEIDVLRETQNLLLKYLKVQVKETPEQPAKKEIVPEEKPITIGGLDINSLNMCPITSCCNAADKLSTTPQPPKPKKPKKSTSRK